MPTPTTQQHLMLSVIAEDQTGIVSTVANVVARHGGNWLESSLSTLRGHFAGIVYVVVETERSAALEADLSALCNQGITVEIRSVNQAHTQAHKQATQSGEQRVIEVQANDREGIVEELTAKLSANRVNVIKLETRHESAAHAGYELFYAKLSVALPQGFGTDELEQALESISDDIMLEFVADDANG